MHLLHLIWVSQYTCLAHLPLDLVSAFLGLPGSHSEILASSGSPSFLVQLAEQGSHLTLASDLFVTINSLLFPPLSLHSSGRTHIIHEKSSFWPKSYVWCSRPDRWHLQGFAWLASKRDAALPTEDLVHSQHIVALWEEWQLRTPFTSPRRQSELCSYE